MGIITAGSLAVASAWLLNRMAVRFWGANAIVYLIPLIEEGAKTLWAYWLAVPIFLTHFFFAGVEAIYDLGASRRTGVYAGMASFFSHMLFGLISMRVFNLFDSIILAVLAGYLIHMLWNFIVIKFLAGPKERR